MIAGVDASSIAAYLAASAQEPVLHVDEHDRVLGVVPRSQVQEEGLITRCTYIFVFNSAGLLCMHQRTLHKRLYPGYWDVAAGGLVSAGETYLQGARRELEEELGVVDAELKPHGRFFLRRLKAAFGGRSSVAVGMAPSACSQKKCRACAGLIRGNPGSAMMSSTVLTRCRRLICCSQAISMSEVYG